MKAKTSEMNNNSPRQTGAIRRKMRYNIFGVRFHTSICTYVF